MTKNETGIQDRTLDAARDLAKRVELDGKVRLDTKRELASLTEEQRSGWLGKWLSLHLGAGKISVEEFLYYKLYDSDLSAEQKKRFVGKKAQNVIHTACNRTVWFATAHNKLVMQMILLGAGLPVPHLQAAFVKGTVSQLDSVYPLSEQSLRTYLESQANYPVFAKPAEGIYSLGAIRVEGYSDDTVALSGDRSVSISDFFEYLEAMDTNGYLFQDVLESHHSLSLGDSSGLACVRVMVLLGDKQPRVHFCTLKIPAGNMDADNYWRAGNSLAPVDTDSGKIGEIHWQNAGIEDASTPDNAGLDKLAGTTISHWPAVLDLVQKAAVLFPGIRTQGWDVALSQDGPKLLELNFGGDLNLHQLAHQKGILDETYTEHIRACGYKRKLP